MVYNGKPSWRNYSNQSNNTVPQTPTVRISDPMIKARLEKLLSNPEVQKNVSATSFMKSMLDQFIKYHSLSEKQVKCIADNELRYDPSSQMTEEFTAWSAEYDESKRSDAIRIAQWYKDSHTNSAKGNGLISVPYYYENTAEKVLGDPNYIPSREAYNKMVGNKFAEKYLENTKNGSRFVAGDVVELSGIKKAIQLYKNKFPHQTGLVIHIADPKKAIKGAYIVTVLPTGTDVMVEVEERWLRTVR